MTIVFSDHACRQIYRRKITRKKVLETIKDPDNLETSFRDRKLYKKRFRDKILEVVVIEEETILTIITAYYL